MTLFHPVVVVDAQLWSLCGDALSEISSCRLVQQSAVSLDMTWYDIVHREAFEDYVGRLTEHYTDSFDDASCETVRPR